MANSARPVHCSMCGLDFEPGNSGCGHGCPLGTHCNLVRCPGCGYEFPGESQSLSWFGRVFGRGRGRGRYGRHRPGGGHGRGKGRGSAAGPAEDDSALSLLDLSTGEQAEMVRLACMSSRQRNTLTVFGLTPGIEVTLLQRRPTYVVRVGETELGLEETLAREIHVKRK